jgi:hypothetical protein
MEPAVVEYLRRLVSTSRGVLGEELVGVYAAGSVALEAYEHGRSDLDVAVVCEGRLSAATKQLLVGCLRHEVLPCPARGLELVVYARQAALSGTTGPGFELELNTGPGLDLRVTLQPEDRPAEDGLFWYGLDRDILHAYGVALTGPPAGQVFAPLADDGLRALLIDSVTWWHRRTPSGEAATPGAEDAVLGACRALVRARRGVWLPKVAAGRCLASESQEQAALLQRATEARSGGPAPSGDETRAFQERVLAELSRAVP